MKAKLSINLTVLMIIYACLLFPLGYSGSIEPYNSIVLLYFVFCAYTIGAALFPKTLSTCFSSFSFAFVALLIGAFMCSFTIFISTSTPFLLSVLGLGSACALFINRRQLSISFKLTAADFFILAISLTLMLLLSRSEIEASLSQVQKGILGHHDKYFFTSITTTFKNGSITNAAFEAGSPVGYQNLGFFIPALIADLLHISSHQALWGMAQPVYKLLAVMLSYDLFFHFFKDKVNRNNYIFALAAIAFPLLLAPIHPLYLVKLNVHNFLFSGMGYLLPAGTVTYPVSMVLVLIAMTIFTAIDWKQKGNVQAKLFFAVLSGLIIIGKVPMYFAFMTFIAGVILVRLVKNKQEKIINYLPYIVLSLIVTVVAFKLCLGYPTLGKTSFRYGYLAQYFAGAYHRSAIGTKNNIIALVLMLVTFIVWLGIRLVGIITLSKTKENKFSGFFIGILTSFSAAIFIGLFLRIENFNLKGEMVRDGTFDVEQFVRSAFYIATLVGAIGLFNLILNAGKPVIRKAVTIAAACWCLLAFVSNMTYPVVKEEESPWYSENYQALRSGKMNDGLIVVNPLIAVYGIMISSCDYGHVWTAMGNSDQCYNGYPKNAYRWDMYAQLIAKPDDALFNAFKKENVRYVISIPEDKDKLDQAAALFPARLKKSTYSSWVYELQ